MANFVLDGRTMQDHYSGIGRYVFHLARGLAEIAPQDRFRVLYNPNAMNTRFDFSKLTQSNLALYPASAKAFTISEQQLALQKTLYADAALWHAPYYALPYALALPLVVTLEDVTPLVLHEDMPNPAKRLAYRTLNQLAAQRARRVITLSNAARNDLVRYLKVPQEKISVVPLATFGAFQKVGANEIERVRTALNLPARYILYLGINKPHKNLVRLVQAWSQVQTDAVLVIAGHWDERYPESQQYVARENLQPRVLFRHNIAESDLSALMGGAAAFVFPSVHEGFGLPPLEAMACGTPVICSNASSLPEVVGDAAVTFDPLNGTDIAYALNRVLNDTNLLHALTAKGLQQAQKFSWERTARETRQVYADSSYL
jgi:glycosyltransferase involved in cell wall biosynthesis